MTEGHLFTCGFCDKKLFRSRKHARRYSRKVHPDKVLKAYKCPVHNGWHYGSLPPGGRVAARNALRKRLEGDG